MTEVNESESAPNPMEMSTSQLRVMTIGVEGGMLIAAVLLGYFLGERFWEDQVNVVRATGIGALASVPLLVLVLGIGETNSKLGDLLRRDFEPVIAMFRNVSVLDIAFISFMAGVCEEALFRGFAQNFLVGHIGEIYSLLLVSIVFGLVHFLSFSYFIFASLIGLYLGGLYIWTGNLVVPIAAHAVYDFVALVYGTRLKRWE